MKKYIEIVCLMTLCGSVVTAALFDASVTLQVVDEYGTPVEGAEAVVVFRGASETNPKAHDEFGVKGLTDSNGKFTATAKARAWFDYNATKPGYYEARNVKTYMFRDIEGNRLVPWNPTLQLVMKKIGNPVPMYVRERAIQIPVENQKTGFDLQVGDWVAPYGKGEKADFVFCFERHAATGGGTVKLVLSFSNENDGIQPVEAKLNSGSGLDLPRVAPEAGYQPEWVIREGDENRAKNTPPTPDRSFVFRVRSRVASGSVKALYGKIRGDFGYAGFGSGRPGVLFTYYLNPDGTRNLEFDKTKNLSKGVKSYECYPWP